MELNLDDVHPDLQEQVQTIHDAMTAIMGATHLPTEVRRIALQESENLYDEAFDDLQNEDDNADSDDGDDFDDEDDGDEHDDEDEDDDEGAEEAHDRFPGEDDMPEAGDEDDDV